ncbi:MAG: hydroxyphenylacetyl-CoA thioesterase PaaI [Gammaproteobacteria bacterium]|nr:hydroxyphenylacetyl-CoA thioesterase PaaI [Gammaproteobacteria bacterium]
MNELAMAKRCAEKMWASDSASKALGMEIDIPAAGSATARMRVREDMVNGFDVCHGGLLFALADTAFAFACNAYDRVTVAGSASIEFLRPAMRGDALIANATEDYRGRRSGYYTVRVDNQDGEAVALFRGRCVSRDEPVLDD